MVQNQRLIKIIASLFYVGYLPASGTIASIFAVLVYFITRDNSLIYNLITIFFVCIAFIVAKKAKAIFKNKDPRQMVFDEVAGMSVTFLFVPFCLKYAIIGFVLFRFFDILKVWPLNRIERLNRSSSIVLDDICAGIYANIILQIIYRLG